MSEILTLEHYCLGKGEDLRSSAHKWTWIRTSQLVLHLFIILWLITCLLSFNLFNWALLKTHENFSPHPMFLLYPLIFLFFSLVKILGIYFLFFFWPWIFFGEHVQIFFSKAKLKFGGEGGVKKNHGVGREIFKRHWPNTGPFTVSYMSMFHFATLSLQNKFPLTLYLYKPSNFFFFISFII
jgi:hypothetical protein